MPIITFMANIYPCLCICQKNWIKANGIWVYVGHLNMPSWSIALWCVPAEAVWVLVGASSHVLIRSRAVRGWKLPCCFSVCKTFKQWQFILNKVRFSIAYVFFGSLQRKSCASWSITLNGNINVMVGILFTFSFLLSILLLELYIAYFTHHVVKRNSKQLNSNDDITYFQNFLDDDRISTKSYST